ncbi:CCT domain [Arabidopsis thaliana x Arabidopsis arenosa]|uniref:CCT domain n=1 Tax=Arabidopsis thaliana x Arabidopsis arenosa TaxID=1240361 RepID=A0A8T1YXZ9_9BRAS|nr:CCT domain [Arabidopsis thaliana x Arabidopsis arenosa]
MCSNKTSPIVGEEKQSTRTSKRIKKRKNREATITMEEKSPSNLDASRKIRTKTKKPKFLSLKLELNTSHEINENSRAKKSKKKKNKKQSKKKEPDTTPFKEKKRAETTLGGGEKEEEQYDTVAAYLFNSATDSTISSIHDLLPTSAATDIDCGGERNNLSPYDRQEHGSSSSSLLKTAMRKGASEEEETTEERWVSYSEVVEEVMSRSGTPRCCGGDGNDGRPSLALKLDYEQIMEAWSDKGTLYIDGEPPQTVPDLHASTDVSKPSFFFFFFIWCFIFIINAYID